MKSCKRGIFSCDLSCNCSYSCSCRCDLMKRGIPIESRIECQQEESDWRLTQGEDLLYLIGRTTESYFQSPQSWFVIIGSIINFFRSFCINLFNIIVQFICWFHNGFYLKVRTKKRFRLNDYDIDFMVGKNSHEPEPRIEIKKWRKKWIGITQTTRLKLLALRWTWEEHC